MSAGICAENGLYALHTDHTSYLFRVRPDSGHLEHLYYGARIPCTPGLAEALAPRTLVTPGCSISYSEKLPALCMDRLCGEISTEGKGDQGAPFVALQFADGSRTADFVFESAAMPAEKPLPDGLPAAYDADAVLVVTLHDADRPALKLELTYAAYAAADTITRAARLINGTDAPLRLTKLASAQLDLPDSDYVFTVFRGGWADEMHRCDTLLNGVSAVCESRGGPSGNHANPFTMLARPGASETSGEVLGMNLVYSGGHRTDAECGAFSRLRWQTGFQPEGFAWTLAPGEAFAAPEAVLSWSGAGYGGLSAQLHAFVQRHIVRGAWRDRERPVLLNSWEACYMKFDEGKLLRLARAGRDCGVELFVLDDGWFGARDDDTSSLGDWTENRKKLPQGLRGLAEKVEKLGMRFGLWVEPEMVSVRSELYRAHPDWALAAPGRAHSEGRHQRVLDLARTEVQDYLIETLGAVFSSAAISYVKWDMNRNWSDLFSAALPPERQGEAAFRYYRGLYRVLAALNARFPEILFESCASGGNRADLGMLCYMPQFWASDNTDAVSRARIQTGYSYGYPLSVLGCHVSACPNHQTLRTTSLDTRFAVALCGVLGYELDFTELSGEERRAISAQIALYRRLRPWLCRAAYYRLENGDASPAYAGAPLPGSGMRGLPHYRWCAVSPDRQHAVAGDLQLIGTLNNAPERFCLRGLSPETVYHFSHEAVPVDIRPFGSLVNTMSPVHIKPGGVLHAVAAHFVHLPGDSEDTVLSGAALMCAGAALCPAFVGTGYAEGVRYLPDFGSRLYFAEAMPADPETEPEPAAQAEPNAAAAVEKAPAAENVSADAPAAQTEPNAAAAPAVEKVPAAENVSADVPAAQAEPNAAAPDAEKIPAAENVPADALAAQTEPNAAAPDAEKSSADAE